MTRVFPALIAHEAETGGGPTGFGWASFLTLLVGLAVLAFMLGRYLQTLHGARRRDAARSAAPGSHVDDDSRAAFDPYDDLHRD